MKKFNKYLFKKLGLITNEDLVYLEKSFKEEIESLKEENEKLKKGLKSQCLVTLKKTHENLKSLEKGLAVVQSNSLLNDLKKIVINKNFFDNKDSNNQEQRSLKNESKRDELEINLTLKEFIANSEIIKNSIELFNKQNIQLSEEMRILNEDYKENLNMIIEENEGFKKSLFQLKDKNKELNLKNESLIESVNDTSIKYNNLKKSFVAGFFILVGIFFWSFTKYNKLEDKHIENTSNFNNTQMALNQFETLEKEINFLKEKIEKNNLSIEKIDIATNKFIVLEKEIDFLKGKIFEIDSDIEGIHTMPSKFITLEKEINLLKEKITDVKSNIEGIRILSSDFTNLKDEIVLLKNNENQLNKKIESLEKKYDLSKSQKELTNYKKVTSQKIVKKKYNEDDIYTKLLELGFRGENAISEFQRKKGLKPTGIADEKTLTLMGLM